MTDVATAFEKFADIIANHQPHIINGGYADADDFAEVSRTTGEITDAVRVYLHAVLADAADNSSLMLNLRDVKTDIDVLYEVITALFDDAVERYEEYKREAA
jgi:hypothetical protein